MDPEEIFAEFRKAVEDEIEPSRELSLALTKLDEFKLWLTQCTPKKEVRSDKQGYGIGPGDFPAGDLGNEVR